METSEFFRRLDEAAADGDLAAIESLLSYARALSAAATRMVAAAFTVKAKMDMVALDSNDGGSFHG